MSDVIKALFESDDLTKTYVPDFLTFMEDPDKWLSQLPGYGDETFGDETDPQAQTDEFEAGAGDVQMQGEDTGTQVDGDNFGDTGATGGETGGDAGAGFGDAQTQTETDEFSQTQTDDSNGGQTQTDEFSQTQTDDAGIQTEETDDFSTEEDEPVADDSEFEEKKTEEI